ncbi:putative triacylglycerol lipase [Neolentinus lepideus HHB14362 ss-1]|uniref:Putative triacylglycerol lipase n=1 Tax=Neolentinus lepideus HHB14362 ss-1 TaxID=1314782 RepID=A0A165UGH4_9AGAM|nr:putative triacylglycerol lipase [Neolentinus lepideus HHB14362 ss-1]
MVFPLSVFPLLVASVLAVSPLVNVDYARYQGTARPGGVTDWFGIRFAAPPLGNLRFTVPQDPLPEEGVQIADKHGLICLQTGAAANVTRTSEDCLFLDVYAPSAANTSSKLPVYFFIQGGGFNENANANYNGTGLIEASGMNIVVVNFNYRVGPYGFLASREVEAGGSLNNGLLDQRKALEWVQKYISRFGGDPNHVVMGGDSGGAASVTYHLTAYGGRNDGLFHAVAAESQSFATMLTVNESQFQYNNLVVRAGCAGASDTLACLRNLTAAELQTIIHHADPSAHDQPALLYTYGPTIDGTFISDYTYRLFAEGKFIRVPSIFGDDTNEGTIFAYSTTDTLGESDAFLQSRFPYLTLQQLGKINSLYPKTNESFPLAPNAGKYWRQCANAFGEIRYICPGIYISGVLQNAGVPGSWNYHYNVEDPTEVAEGLGVPHTVELNAIWGPQYVSGRPPASYFTTNAHVVPIMQGYWTSFIRSFDPNTYRYPGSAEWETWGEQGYQRLLIQSNGTTMETVPQDQQARCAYLSSIGIEIKQ